MTRQWRRSAQRALAARLAALDSNLNSVAHGYVAPERMTELLRSLLTEQRGLTLVSLANLPVESFQCPRLRSSSGHRAG